ncbi:MAG: glycosyltransferase family 2 protein [Rhodopirellula sp. JB053]
MNDWLSLLMLWVFPAMAFVLALVASMMFANNLPMFTRWRGGQLNPVDEQPSVSVLIPARNEAAGIRQSVESILENTGADLEVVVLDDDSEDDTAQIVRELSDADTRVRLIQGRGLPEGWNGKQHACYQLAEAAKHDLLLFLDADVRLRPTALQQLARRKAQSTKAVRDGSIRMELNRGFDEGNSGSGYVGESLGLLSAFPHQETGTLLEKLLIPMMHYILLCYLPFQRMRSSASPAFASGCGQLFFTDRESYRRSGTHEAIRSSRHDGIKLPKAYRHHGMMTDCVDGTDVASCRMYTSAGEVVRGLLKNATEGIANFRLLVPFTVLLGGGNLLPYVVIVYAMTIGQDSASARSVNVALILSVAAIVLSHMPRWVAAKRFRQSIIGAILHPVSIVVFLVLQWTAFFNHLTGKQIAWRGRST